MIVTRYKLGVGHSPEMLHGPIAARWTVSVKMHGEATNGHGTRQQVEVDCSVQTWSYTPLVTYQSFGSLNVFRVLFKLQATTV
jgi:hypothetical protein